MKEDIIVRDNESSNNVPQLSNNELESQKVTAYHDIAKDSINMMNNAIDCWKQSIIIERDIARLKTIETITLAKIAADYQKSELALNKIFAERQEALASNYKALQYGLDNNDREVIVNSLHQIANIVTSKPLEDFDKLLKVWNDDKQPLELDF